MAGYDAKHAGGVRKGLKSRNNQVHDEKSSPAENNQDEKLSSRKRTAKKQSERETAGRSAAVRNSMIVR